MTPVGKTPETGAGPYGTITASVSYSSGVQERCPPTDPSSYDTIQFQETSSDPAGGTISAQQWNFGDGSTATGCCPTHRYAQDGDYTVNLTVTTDDGRSASTSQVVRVRTYDVAVVQITVPNTARVGQTVAINVYLRNTHYSETVRVDLAKSTPYGTTRLAFSYTITQADQTAGTLNFRAAATLFDYRDARPDDNVLTSSYVRVT